MLVLKYTILVLKYTVLVLEYTTAFPGCLDQILIDLGEIKQTYFVQLLFF